MAVRPTGSDPTDTWMMLTGKGDQELDVVPTPEEDRKQELEAEEQATKQGTVIALPNNLYQSHFCEDGPPAQILELAGPRTPKNTPERIPTPPLPNQEPANPEPLDTETAPVGRQKNCWDSFLEWICCKRKME